MSDIATADARVVGREDAAAGFLHITETGLSDDAWAVACAIGATAVALCGFTGPARHVVPGDAPLCPSCAALGEASGLEVRW